MRLFMKKILFITLCLLAVVTAGAQNASVQSPDGRLKLYVYVQKGRATYSVSYDGQTVLGSSPLGFVASMGNFSEKLKFITSETKHQQFSYTMTRSKKSHIDNEDNSLLVTLENDQQRQFCVRFNVSNNDIAFRYEMDRVADKVNGKKTSIRIMQEKTGFRMPEGTTTFLTPQCLPMMGWKSTKPSYEEDYVYDEQMITASKYSEGYTFPCLFKVNPKSGQSLWVLLSETDVDSRYCGSHLSTYHGKGLYTVDFPLRGENNGNGTLQPAFALPGHTPWRTITVGKTLKPIVETTVPWDYVEQRYEPSQKYVYGKGTWSWIVWQDASINYDDQVKFIDLAHAMGYKYVLIDNWWDTNIGKDGIEKLVKYAHRKKVDVFLWHSSSGYWNDIEQGPVNMMDNTIERKKEMAWLKKIGIKGIKVDFFGGDKQETMRLYEDILSDANDYGLMVIFHGCTIPRGWERMYPNYVGSEAVLASENLFFEQKHCDNEARETATHPFIRNTIGCMEWGGSFMNTRIGKDNKSGNTRRTTFVHELAQAVLFQNPIQNFAITPENLGLFDMKDQPAPEICMDFLKYVPTEWDDVKFIDGYPGRYCVLARRHDKTWYIAGNNATGKPLTLTLDLPMLNKGDKVFLFADKKKTAEPTLTETKIKDPQKVEVTMAVNGGFVIVK